MKNQNTNVLKNSMRQNNLYDIDVFKNNIDKWRKTNSKLKKILLGLKKPNDRYSKINFHASVFKIKN